MSKADRSAGGDRSGKETVAHRLTEAELATNRFINVKNGGKKSTDHTQVEAAKASGNYGVYAGRGLVLIDIDDYGGDFDLTPINGLQDTFTVATPNGGEHRYYHVPDAADVFNDAFSVYNPVMEWGEVRVRNQYVVGPGSTNPDGDVRNQYEITENRPIAQISAYILVGALRATGYDTTDDSTDADSGESDAPTHDVSIDDAELIEKAQNGKNGDDFTRLWNGNTTGYPSHSEADLALCNHLAFWTGNDRSRIDSLFRQSGLYREKWDRDDYRERTIQKAVNGTSDTYDPKAAITQTDGGATVATPSGEPSLPSSDATGWDVVYRQYGNASEAEERKPARFQAAELLSEDYYWANLEENDQLYAYTEGRGIYEPNGEKRVRELLVEHLKEEYAKNEKNELLDQLRGRHTVSQEEMGGPANHIPVRNGVLEVETQGLTLKDHDPQYRFLGSVATDYDPDAECPRFKSFLNDVVKSGAGRKKLQEYAGYTLMHWGLPHHKALFLVGPTASGKSTFLDTIRAVLGSETVVSLTPQELTGERFAGAELFQSWANFRNDIPSSLIEDTGAFKEITAGDSIKAERKFKDPFRFEPTAKHLFSANQLPDAETEDEAFYRRVLLVPFPSTVPRNKRDPQLDDKLQDELPGVLNWMLEGLQRLMQQGKFTADRTPGETQRTWEKWGNTVDRFRENCLETDETADLTKKTAYKAYHAYCEAENLPAETQHKMTRRLKAEGIADGRSYVDGKQQRVFVGVTLNDRGEQYLEDPNDESDDTDGRGLDSFGGES